MYYNYNNQLIRIYWKWVNFVKKVLILTISTGHGHNQAAASVSGSFEDRGYEIVKHDFLQNNSKFLNDIIVKGYEIMA